ncbi:MAG: hypothetical protein J0I21_05820 [Alphaproteobacteria bacterium]|nr:hypothetical protein [Alphaproteobacteria bacterium]
MRAAAGLVLLVLLGGCREAAQLTGLATGGVAGAATASPAVGFAVALGVQVAADEIFKRVGRSRQHTEQNAIAAVAGALPEGGTAPWVVHHTIPIGNEDGEVQVVRLIANPLAECREIVFSVADPPKPAAWYATSICRDRGGWQWALAEPAVPRWGFLKQ